MTIPNDKKTPLFLGSVLIAALASLSLLGLSGCKGDSIDYLYRQADTLRGGNLWDEWWVVPDVKEGVEPGADGSNLPADNPLYATGEGGKSGSTTWRCKECHGWDYKGKDGAYGSGSHKTGFAGVWDAQNKSVRELFNAIADGKEGHKFNQVLSDDDILSLARFIKEGLVDDDELVDKDSKLAKGDEAKGAEKFGSNCVNCHGADGKTLNFGDEAVPEHVLDVARDNPWEFLHKVRFGQPNGEMPNGLSKGYTLEDAKNILAHAQGLGDPMRGAHLYDEWWEVKSVKEGIQPGGSITVDGETVSSSLPADNPLYATGEGGKSGSTTWRCKECHGWDYKGKDGAYGSGSHRTGFMGVFASKTKTRAELGAAMVNSTKQHDFSSVMSAQDIYDLVNFIVQKTDDSSDVVNSDKTVTGDKDQGLPLFGEHCIGCHGVDGKKLNFAAGSDTTEYLYDVASDNPWEALHKVRFGQPNGEMPDHETEMTRPQMADLLAYAQSLSVPGLEGASAIHGGLLYDKWWEDKGLEAPANDNPGYAQTEGTKSGATTWRCKECHGWDYKGVGGAYGSGSHRTGVIGVWDAQNLDVDKLIAAIGQGKKPADNSAITGHAFETDGHLSAGDVKDLALFIKTALADDSAIIDYSSGRSKGNAVAGKVRYTTTCKACHGALGSHINFAHDEGPLTVEYPGDIARDNPWELAHKLRFGQPGSGADSVEMNEEFQLNVGRMPNRTETGFREEDVANVIAYAATLPTAVQRGGMLYDEWWNVDGVAEPIEPGGSVTVNDTTTPSSLPETNPSYTNNTNGAESGPDTWLCNTCHGFDYKGRDGVYGSGEHFTGVKGVWAGKDKDGQVLFDTIANGQFTDDTGAASGTPDHSHAFLDVLGDWAVRDLVMFIKEGTIDYAAELVDPSTGLALAAYDGSSTTVMHLRTRDANPLLGQTRFNTVCAQCHGYDGTAINFHEEEGEQEYVPTIGHENPWELLSKIRNGTPGSDPMMPNANGLGMDTDDIADLLVYIQMLP